MSFSPAQAIRRRLQLGFSWDMRTMSATISSASGRRPIGLDLFAQNRAKPRRCHAITVAGFTIARTSAQRDQVRESTTQKARTSGRRRGRGVDRRRIESCWRSARFSRTRLARGRKVASTAPTIASSTLTIAQKIALFRVAVTGESPPPTSYPCRRLVFAICRKDRPSGPLIHHHRPPSRSVSREIATRLRGSHRHHGRAHPDPAFDRRRPHVLVR